MRCLLPSSLSTRKAISQKNINKGKVFTKRLTKVTRVQMPVGNAGRLAESVICMAWG